ncbi:MAG: Hsp70 family protein [Candidatus Binatia bacterium]|nr:Hsp70 family protein [Candidatus Binatia bacterium]
MPRYVVGIDLGTTNSALAYVPLEEDSASVMVLPIPQLVTVGAWEERSLLPSFLYIPTLEESSSAGYRSPWAPAPGFVIGELARRRGAEAPQRLIASAKSWLCVDTVDRQSPILPWGSEADVHRLSPVEVSARYLEHLRTAWDQRFPDSPLAEQEVFIGVPASFDPVARELTMRAALLAGLERVTLIEEPLAAFYAWLAGQGDEWREQVRAGDLVLVCDVGGGTTDFTLIEVRASEGQLVLERIAVGDHILLGGDNMDLALAHAVRARLEAAGHPLDTWQFQALALACREAKETLLRSAGEKQRSFPVALLGKGSRLIGGTIRTEIERELVEELLTEGFFPFCSPESEPEDNPLATVAEWGLPYAADAAITRHLAAFLHRARAASGARVGLPSAVLFHGGVFHSEVFRHRVMALLARWSRHAPPPRSLPGTDFEHAVARGAAYYGFVRKRGGVRIRGGVAHAFYLGIAAAMPAVPGMQPPIKAFCIVPRGLEEGAEVELPQREFALTVGRESVFRFFQSAVRSDPAGALVEHIGPEFHELPPVRTCLPGSSAVNQRIPVYLQAKVNELGTLELWFVQRSGGGRWKLEFDLRAAGQRTKGGSR